MSDNPTHFTRFEGGLEVAVLHMSRHDLLHQTALNEVLCKIIESEAHAHKADFKTTKFGKIINAVKKSKISAYFLLAGWENCQRHIIGASIEYPTVLTKWENDKFVHYPAMYGEDTCLLTGAIKELIREKPPEMFFDPNIGLAEFLELEKIKRWTTNQYGDAPLGMAARARIGEYSAHSKAMIKILDELGATRSTVENGAILEIDGLTEAMKGKWKVHTITEGITPVGQSEPNPDIFCVRWSSLDGKQQLCASFTNGISSFTGDAVTRVQLTSNGNLPHEMMLQCVLASLLEAGQEEICARRWGAQEDNYPVDSLVETHKCGMYAKLIAAAKREYTKRRIILPLRDDSWSYKPPVMRIHASNNPKLVKSDVLPVMSPA
jgi:hypothetical protein